MDGVDFANKVRKAYRDEIGVRFDVGIASLIGLTGGRVSHLLGAPFDHSADVILKLLKGIQRASTRKELFRSWLMEKYANEITDDVQTTGQMRGAEQKMEEARRIEQGLTASMHIDHSTREHSLQKAIDHRLTLFEVGYAMQNLMENVKRYKNENNTRAIIGCHITRVELLFQVERIRFGEIQRVVRGIEKMIEESRKDESITFDDAKNLQLELRGAIAGLKLYRFLNSRSNMTQADAYNLCEETEAICNSTGILIRSRLGLLTTLTSVYTHLGELDDAKRVLGSIRRLAKHGDIGLLLLEARLLRAEGHLSAARRALIEVHTYCLAHGMLMMAVFAQKELAATVSDDFPDLPTGSRSKSMIISITA